MEFQRMKIDLMKLSQHQQMMEERLNKEIHDLKKQKSRESRRSRRTDTRQSNDVTQISEQGDSNLPLVLRKKKRRVVSVKRYRVETDGSRTLVSERSCSAARSTIQDENSIKQTQSDLNITTMSNQITERSRNPSEGAPKKAKVYKVIRHIKHQRNLTEFTPKHMISTEGMSFQQLTEEYKKVREQIQIKSTPKEQPTFLQRLEETTTPKQRLEQTTS